MLHYLPDHLAEEERKLFFEYCDIFTGSDDEWDVDSYVREHGSDELNRERDEFVRRRDEARKQGIIID